MAVILANCTLSARKKVHTYARDAHGTPVAGAAWGDPTPAYPGAVVEPQDGAARGGTWNVRADVRLHPLTADDELTTDDGRVFIVRTARLVTVPGYDYVDYVQVTADLSPPVKP